MTRPLETWSKTNLISNVPHPKVAACQVGPTLGVLLINGDNPAEAPDGVPPGLLLNIGASEDKPRTAKERVDGKRSFKVGNRGLGVAVGVKSTCDAARSTGRGVLRD